MKYLLVVFMSLCTFSTAFASDFLKPEEVKQLMVGKKILARAPNGSMFDFQMNEDGSASTSAAGGDTGKWRLNDEGYCVTWQKIRKGAEMCFKVTKRSLGQHFVIYPDGTHIAIVRID